MSSGYHSDPRPDIQALFNPTGTKILDVGCGAGALGRALKDAGASYVAGIERHAQAAAGARDRLDDLLEGDILELALPFPPHHFDVIIFADVLEHLPDPAAALRRCLPLLAPDGRVIVSVPNMRFYLVLLRLIFDRWAYTDSGVRDRTHLRIVTRRSLIELLAGEGLRVELLLRHYRLIEDQSEIGRIGAVATRIVGATIAPLLFRDLLAFQYVVVARRSP